MSPNYDKVLRILFSFKVYSLNSGALEGPALYRNFQVPLRDSGNEGVVTLRVRNLLGRALGSLWGLRNPTF